LAGSIGVDSGAAGYAGLSLLQRNAQRLLHCARQSADGQADLTPRFLTARYAGRPAGSRASIVKPLFFLAKVTLTV
jgi:hypothetical protein